MRIKQWALSVKNLAADLKMTKVVFIKLKKLASFI